MIKIHYLNHISPKGTALWTKQYEMTQEMDQAQAVLVRSASMHGLALPQGLLAVARAGAGVNNIPLEACAQAGVVVFNTPGANANGVVELVLCGMLLGCRDVIGGIEYVRSIAGTGDVAKQVEKAKARFSGFEIRGKKLGVIGLGAVGGPLANDARKLGMEVYGYDPFISVDAAWHLDSHVIRVDTLEALFAQCDIISLHTPLLPQTRGMIDRAAIEKMRPGTVLLNFARDALVDDEAVEEALRTGKLRRYITDFPNDRTAAMAGVVPIPHLGASTQESEDNCARMAVGQVMDYLENGNIRNSVNFPDCDMGICAKTARVAILHRNIPGALSRATAAVAAEGINISDLVNRSKGAYAYTMLDLDDPVSDAALDHLRQLEGVLRVRKIK